MTNSGPRRVLEPSLIAKKIWLSFHPTNFGSHVTVRPSDRPGKPMRNLTFSG